MIASAPRATALAVALLTALAACTGERPESTHAAAPVVATDDGGNAIRLQAPAQRVISLVPSGTDLITALGAHDRLVGRTRYDRAPNLAELPSVGGGLDPSAEGLLALRPDLVIVWETDARHGMRRQLAEAGVATFALQSRDTSDVYRATMQLGALLGLDSAASALVARLRGELDAVRADVAADAQLPPRVLYAVSLAPPMVAGSRLFMGQLVGVAGGELLFGELDAQSPAVSPEELVRRAPDVVVLPSGDDTVQSLARLRAAPGWREIAAVRDGRVVLIPVDLANRPGPDIGAAARHLRAGFVRVRSRVD